MDIKTITSLRADSAKYKSLAKKIDDLLLEYDHSNAQDIDVDNNRIPTPPPTPCQPPGRVRDLSNETQADACFKVLTEAGRPLRRDEIFEIVTSRGSAIKSAKNLSPILSRDKRFISVERGVWTVQNTKAGNENQHPT